MVSVKKNICKDTEKEISYKDILRIKFQSEIWALTKQLSTNLSFKRNNNLTHLHPWIEPGKTNLADVIQIFKNHFIINHPGRHSNVKVT